METIFGWQVAVVISIIIARFISSGAMVLVAICWSIFTFLAVGVGWLILLQLSSAWGTTWALFKLFGGNHDADIDMHEISEIAPLPSNSSVERYEATLATDAETAELNVLTARANNDISVGGVVQTENHKCDALPRVNKTTLFRSPPRRSGKISDAEMEQRIAALRAALVRQDTSNKTAVLNEAEKTHTSLLMEIDHNLTTNSALEVECMSNSEASSDTAEIETFLPAKPGRSAKHLSFSQLHVTQGKISLHPLAPPARTADAKIECRLDALQSAISSEDAYNKARLKERERHHTDTKVASSDDVLFGTDDIITHVSKNHRVYTKKRLHGSGVDILDHLSVRGATSKVNKIEVEDCARQLRIPHLVHFTQCKNLSGILRHGLVSVNDCANRGLNSVRNDCHRFDGQLDGISLSIAFPNYKMFWKYRKLLPDTDWAVLLISNRALWEKDCAFYRHNAADARMIRQPSNQLKSAQALRNMFSADNIEREPWLRSYDPTDPQAEVMFYETIEPSFIEAIAFETSGSWARYSQELGGFESFYAGSERGLFASRRSTRKTLQGS